MEKETKFNEKDFTNLLLSLLCKNGIYKVNEEDLTKKLFYYYKNKEYRELFQDIKTTKKHINITSGLYLEQTHTNNIIINPNESENIYLNYNININLEDYKDKLSNEALISILKIAKNVAISIKLENYSDNKLNIYHTNPNNTYTLINGIYKNKNIKTTIITDGKTKIINKIKLENYKRNNKTSSIIDQIQIKNATFTIIQNIENNKIKNITIYTKLEKFNDLKEISDIDNNKNKKKLYKNSK